MAAIVAARGGRIAAEYQEVERGKRVNWLQLAAVLSACRARRACLLIAKIDRLARNARFLLAAVAKLEAELISHWTEAAKTRGAGSAPAE